MKHNWEDKNIIYILSQINSGDSEKSIRFTSDKFSDCIEYIKKHSGHHVRYWQIASTKMGSDSGSVANFDNDGMPIDRPPVIGDVSRTNHLNNCDSCLDNALASIADQYAIGRGLIGYRLTNELLGSIYPTGKSYGDHAEFIVSPKPRPVFITPDGYMQYDVDRNLPANYDFNARGKHWWKNSFK